MNNASNRGSRHVIFVIAIIISHLACSKTGTDVQQTPPPSPPQNPPPPPTPAQGKKWVVSTFSGSGETGVQNGTSSTAQFNRPLGLTLDANGNLFVGDSQNRNIRKINSQGDVTTYAGPSVTSPDIPWGNIYGIVADDQGNLFDIEYEMIRKISSPQTSSVFVGGLTLNYLDGTGTNAQFNVIGNLTRDMMGNLYVPDYDMNNIHHIRKITPNADVSTLTVQDNTNFPDNGLPNYYYLYAIAADSVGNLYVTGNGNTIIKKVDVNGVVTVLAGAGNIAFTDGIGSQATFGTIWGLATDKSGNVWVADGLNHAVRMVTPEGKVTTIAGLGTAGFADGDSSKAQFNYPSGIVVDKNGIVYVTDFGNNRIRKIEYK